MNTVSVELATLARQKGFKEEVHYFYNLRHGKLSEPTTLFDWSDVESVIAIPYQEQLQNWIRKNRGVNICIYPNASSWLWSMSTVDKNGFGGTDLGFSEYSGNNLSGGWDTYEECLENALFVQLSLDVGKYDSHYGNYAVNAVEEYKKQNHSNKERGIRFYTQEVDYDENYKN